MCKLRYLWSFAVSASLLFLSSLTGQVFSFVPSSLSQKYGATKNVAATRLYVATPHATPPPSSRPYTRHYFVSRNNRHHTVTKMSDRDIDQDPSDVDFEPPTVLNITSSSTDVTSNLKPVEKKEKESLPSPPITTTLASLTGQKTIKKITQFFKANHVALIAAAILLLSLFLNPLPSLAVQSGGRMGGSFSSGGNGRSSGGSPAVTRSYGSGYSRGFNRGYGAGYFSRPNVVVSPFYNPFYNPFWTPGYYARPGVVVSTGGGGGLFSFLVFGGLAVAVALAFSNALSGGGGAVLDGSRTFSTSGVRSALGSGVSVAQLSVALDVPNRDSSNSILSVLGRLANTARTDSRVGIQNLTSQVALELLRRKQSIIAASSKYNHYNDVNKAQREFNNLAIKERGKFERETVSKYGGVDYSEGGRELGSSDVYSPKATVAVVTIILAIEGDSTKVPRIGSLRDVEDALSRIASDAKVDDCLQSAEILWTPEDRSETLTQRDIFADYPSLRSV